MTMYAGRIDRIPDAGKPLPFERLSRWARALGAFWQSWQNSRATSIQFGWMNDAELGELGVERVGRGVRWMDHGEALPFGDFEYRDLAAGASRHAAD